MGPKVPKIGGSTGIDRHPRFSKGKGRRRKGGGVNHCDFSLRWLSRGVAHQAGVLLDRAVPVLIVRLTACQLLRLTIAEFGRPSHLLIISSPRADRHQRSV